MDLFSLILTAVGLSMDAFAVSVTSGMVTNGCRIMLALRVGLFFGFFQALMPIVGWVASTSFSSYIADFDHWIAMGLLGFIGLKMIYGAVAEKEEQRTKVEKIDNKSLFLLAVATSIDALAVGVSFAFLKIAIIQSALLIGFTTLCISASGVLIGRKFGSFFGNKAEIIGGVILIFIGVRILLEHLL